MQRDKSELAAFGTRERPLWDATHDARRAFRASLAALSAPGQLTIGMPRAWLFEDLASDHAAALLLALVDGTQGVAHAGDLADVAAALRTRSGSMEVPVEGALFVLAPEDRAADAVRRAPKGTRAEPHLGATVVVVADEPTRWIQLSAPGWSEDRRALLPLSRPLTEALADANGDPPRGVDLFLVNAHGIAALPRYVRCAWVC
jgi:phosphonate C-P lyase system protein PhnH